MCISPIRVKNRWYLGNMSEPDRNLFMLRHKTWFLHDVSSVFINVPCGVCGECLQARQNELVQRCFMLSKYCYTLFGTLTYQNSALPSVSINGYNIKFAYVKDFQNFIKRLRKYEVLPNFRYVAFTEYGGDSDNKHYYRNGHLHRPHFHFLFFIPYDKDDKVSKWKGFEYCERVLSFIPSKYGWSRSVCVGRNPLYIPNSRFIRRYNSYTYDCQFVNGNTDRVVYYVTKYLLKFSDYVSRLQSALRLNLCEVDYKYYWSFIRPHLLTSNGLGCLSDKQKGFCEVDEQINQELLKMYEYSLDNKSGKISFFLGNKVVPMCNYFVKRTLCLQYAIDFHNINYEYGPFEDSVVDPDVYLNNFQEDYLTRLDKQVKFLSLQKRIAANRY